MQTVLPDDTPTEAQWIKADLDYNQDKISEAARQARIDELAQLEAGIAQMLEGGH